MSQYRVHLAVSSAGAGGESLLEEQAPAESAKTPIKVKVRARMRGG
jgi:hypothetical protein